MKMVNSVTVVKPRFLCAYLAKAHHHSTALIFIFQETNNEKEIDTASMCITFVSRV